MSIRPATALILLCLSLAAGFGHIVTFLIGREFAREQQLRRMARLDPSCPVTLVPESPGIRWEEKGKEMILDGRLYDVLEARETAAGIEFVVIADDRETEVLDRYLDRTGHTDPDGKGYRIPSQNPLSSVWLITHINNGQPLAPISASGLLQPRAFCLAPAPFIAVSVPPPIG